MVFSYQFCLVSRNFLMFVPRLVQRGDDSSSLDIVMQKAELLQNELIKRPLHTFPASFFIVTRSKSTANAEAEQVTVTEQNQRMR